MGEGGEGGQKPCAPPIYQNPPYIHPEAQHSLMQFPQPRRKIAQFQSYGFSSVRDSANSQGG